MHQAGGSRGPTAPLALLPLVVPISIVSTLWGSWNAEVWSPGIQGIAKGSCSLLLPRQRENGR